MGKLSDRLATEFLQGPVQSLLRQDVNQEKRNSSVRQIYRLAGQLASSLWTRRAFMKPYGLQNLAGYANDSPVMTAHRLHHLDEDDKSLDGNKALAVIQPVILAHGNEEGENYDKWKVWSKAVVLVEEKPQEDVLTSLVLNDNAILSQRLSSN
jgi:hypothetical protein